MPVDAVQSTLGVFVSINTLGMIAITYALNRFRSDSETIKKGNEKLIEDRFDSTVRLIDEKHLALTRLLDERQELTSKLIDERLRRISHDMNNNAQRNMTAVDAVTIRMEKAMDKIEATTDELGKKDNSLEMQMLNRINKVQMEIAQQVATKEDLRLHQQSMDQKVGKLETKIDAMAKGEHH